MGGWVMVLSGCSWGGGGGYPIFLVNRHGEKVCKFVNRGGRCSVPASPGEGGGGYIVFLVNSLYVSVVKFVNSGRRWMLRLHDGRESIVRRTAGWRCASGHKWMFMALKALPPSEVSCAGSILDKQPPLRRPGLDRNNRLIPPPIPCSLLLSSFTTPVPSPAPVLSRSGSRGSP